MEQYLKPLPIDIYVHLYRPNLLDSSRNIETSVTIEARGFEASRGFFPLQSSGTT